MAQWTNSSGSWMRPYLHPWGAPHIKYYQESTAASTATIRVGHAVSNNTVITTGGQRIVRAPSSAGTGTNLLEVLTASLIGVAVEASTSDGGLTGLIDDSTTPSPIGPRSRMIGVAVADGVTQYLGYFKSGGAGTTPRALSSLIGLNRPVILDSTLNLHFIDSTNSTVALVAVRIIDFPQDVLGDSGGVPCVFKFLSSNVHASVNVGGQPA